MDGERFLKIIDFHVHIYPDSVAAKVAATIGLPEEAKHPERLTAEGITAAAKRAGVTLSVNLPVATKAEHVENTNRYVRSMPEGVISFAALHPDTPNKREVLTCLKAEGFKGIKFHPEFQNFALEEERMREAWEAMSDLGLIAVFHAGGDRCFPPPYHTSPRTFVDFAKKYPKLKIVAAHMGGYMMWYETELELAGKADIYLDTSWMTAMCDAKQLVRTIRKHGADKILFASDSPWREPKDDIAAILALPLEDEEKEMILHKNAERLLELC